MTLLTSEHNEVSVGALHDLDPDEFNQLYIQVTRRVEPGSGAYGGIPFLTMSEGLSSFDTVEDALAFIDSLQNDGLPDAIRELVGEDLDYSEVMEHLQYSHSEMTATEYLEITGINDPFNLEITPMVETHVETAAENAGPEVRANP